MWRRSLVVSAVALVLCAAACGSSSGDAPTDAGADAGKVHKPLLEDAGDVEGDDASDAKTPWNRMEPHQGTVLAAPHIRAIYIGSPGVDESQSFDGYLEWLLTSKNYWSILAQYGVGYGTFDGSTRIDTAAFFPPGVVNAGLIDDLMLDSLIAGAIHPPPPADAGGLDASDDAEAGAPDASPDANDADASAPAIPPIPAADAYIFFLPDHVNVTLGGEGKTCAEAGGYHSFDGQEPYAVIPPCDFGRSGVAISHEMAEMATDPLPEQGWYSEADINNAGGEIGDLCNMPTNIGALQATFLWSNKDGDCEPNP